MVKSEPRRTSDRHSQKRHRELHDKHKSEPRIKRKLMQLSRSPSPPSLSSQHSPQHSHSSSVSNPPPDSSAIPFPPPPSTNLLRRTTAVHSLTPQDEDENGKTQEEATKAAKEVSGGEWILVKFNCQCSKENRFMVNPIDKKYFKLV